MTASERPAPATGTGPSENTAAKQVDLAAQPIAVVLAVHPTRTGRTVVILCPLCGGKHTHGWPNGAREIGPRVAHCAPPWTGQRQQQPPAPRLTYYVQTPAGAA